jgi:hypothetical protein
LFDVRPSLEGRFQQGGHPPGIIRDRELLTPPSARAGPQTLENASINDRGVFVFRPVAASVSEWQRRADDREKTAQLNVVG